MGALTLFEIDGIDGSTGNTSGAGNTFGNTCRDRDSSEHTCRDRDSEPGTAGTGTVGTAGTTGLPENITPSSRRQLAVLALGFKARRFFEASTADMAAPGATQLADGFATLAGAGTGTITLRGSRHTSRGKQATIR